MISNENKQLRKKKNNYIDQGITQIMLTAERKLSGNELNSPWSPQLHGAVRIVSVWKHILSQEKAKISHYPQIEFLMN